MITLASLASALVAAFTPKTRDNGETYLVLRDGAPQWMIDIVRNAHNGMMPNDTSYGMILAVANELDDLLNNDLEVTFDDLDDARHERIDSLIPVYNNQRSAWLASHLDRAEFVNDAIREYGTGTQTPDIFNLIALGIDAELNHIWACVERGLSYGLECAERADAE